MQATLELRIWTDGRQRMPQGTSEIAKIFAQHLERVSSQCEEGYQSGEIVDSRFRGWWDIQRDDKRTETAKRAMLFIANNCKGEKATAIVNALMQEFGLSAADLYAGKKQPRSHSADLG